MQKINEKLRELWINTLAKQDWPEAIPKLWPLQYTTMQPGKLLFVGMNPSHNDQHTELFSVKSDFREDLRAANRVAQVVKRDEMSMGLHGENLHPYFRVFKEFGQEDGWNHVDLFAVRHTNQAELKHALNLDSESPFDQKFVNAQIEIFKEIVIALQPSAVVVVNALASSLVSKIEDFLSCDIPDECIAKISVGNRDVPLFRSGMLSGQRALDTYSRARLIWHVKSVLYGR